MNTTRRDLSPVKDRYARMLDPVIRDFQDQIRENIRNGYRDCIFDMHDVDCLIAIRTMLENKSYSAAYAFVCELDDHIQESIPYEVYSLFGIKI